MTKNFKIVAISLVKFIAPFFYNRKYLAGKYFRSSNEGWSWVAKGIWRQRILGFNRSIPWPTNHTCVISKWKNIEFHIDDINNFQSPGCYFQNFSAKIFLGKGTYIAPNVGLITANHDLSNLDKHSNGKDIIIGHGCWIGMNSVILPGVNLGNNVIVGAGSVVTKSFLESNITIAGVPAKIIKNENINNNRSTPSIH